MSGRIETFTSKTASEYKYSKNQTIGATSAGVDIGADMPETSGGDGGKAESITKANAIPVITDNHINTTVTIEKEED